MVTVPRSRIEIPAGTFGSILRQAGTQASAAGVMLKCRGLRDAAARPPAVLDLIR